MSEVQDPGFKAKPEARETLWQFAGLGIFSALFLYVHLFQFPWVPVWRFGDQAFCLSHAERMMRGEVLYRDLFQFNLPGTEGLYYALIRCFGPAPWVAALALLVAGTACSLLLYSLARKALPGPAALLPPMALLLVLLRSNLEASHHWYSTLFVLLALRLIVERSTAIRLGAAGALLAVATIFTSTRGGFAAAGVGVFLLCKYGAGRQWLKAMAALLLPFGAVLGGVLAYLAHELGTKLLFDSLIVFPLRYYPLDSSSNSFAVFWDLWHEVFPWRWRSLPLLAVWLAVYAGVPLTFAAFLLGPMRRHLARMRSSTESNALVLIAAVGSALYLSVLNAPSGVRTNCAATLAFVLAAAMLREIGGQRLVHGTIAVAMLAGAGEMAGAELRWKGGVDGPRGAVAVIEPNMYEQFAWVAQHARPGDGIFGCADLEYILGLKNPTPVPFVTANGYTRPGQVESVVAGLERQHTRFFIWNLADPAPTDNLPPLRDYLRQHYHVVRKYGDGTEIRERDSR